MTSNRPTHEMLDPHLLDQRTAYENQFKGMSRIEFSYDDYEATKFQLIETVRASLSEADKAFLFSLNRLASDWSIYDYQRFPAVKWKLLNLEKFKESSPEAYQQQLNELESVLA